MKFGSYYERPKLEVQKAHKAKNSLGKFMAELGAGRPSLMPRSFRSIFGHIFQRPNTLECKKNKIRPFKIFGTLSFYENSAFIFYKEVHSEHSFL